MTCELVAARQLDAAEAQAPLVVEAPRRVRRAPQGRPAGPGPSDRARHVASLRENGQRLADRATAASLRSARRARRWPRSPRRRAPPRGPACRRRPPRAGLDRAGRCRAAGPRSRPRAAARRPSRRSPARCRRDTTCSRSTPMMRMPTFSAIARSAHRDLLRGRLRRRHDHDLGARQQLAERDRDVAGAGGHVDDERVELAPVDVGEELLERAVQHRPAPHDRARCRRGRTRSTSASAPRARAARSSCRRRPAAGGRRACAGSSGRRRRRRGRRRFSPRAASAAARLAVSVDLPTPPLPEAIASTRVPASSEIVFSGRPPRSRVDSAAFSSALITSKWSSHRGDPLDRADESLHLILEATRASGSRRRSAQS